MLLRQTLTRIAIGALLAFNSSAVSQTIDGSFDVDSGCSNYRKGQLQADLDGYFVEARAIINSAATGFQNYATRADVQDTAVAFFGINPDAQNLPPTDQNDENTPLKSVVDLFNKLAAFVNSQSQAPVKLFCDTTWFEGPTAQLYDADGNEIAGTIPAAYPQEPDLATGNKVPYWAAQFKQYFFVLQSDIDKYGDPTTWVTKTDAFTAELSGGTKTLTLSPQELFQGTLLERAPTNGIIGSSLQQSQPKSLTLVHEMIHITQGNDGTPDQLGSTFLEIDPNTGLPTYEEEDYPADTVMECMGLADDLQSLPHKNPQNLAWAAFATYLFDQTKLEWSSGEAIDPTEDHTVIHRRELGERQETLTTNIADRIKARSKVSRAFKG